MKNKKLTLYVDLDDTIYQYTKRHNELYSDLCPFPQSTYGFYTSLEPIENAIESILWLNDEFDLWFLSKPSYMNPLCYTEKRVSIEKYFGLEMCKKLILCYDKSLLKGDILIDDRYHEGFEGELILFKNWEITNKYISVKYL